MFLRTVLDGHVYDETVLGLWGKWCSGCAGQREGLVRVTICYFASSILGGERYQAFWLHWENPTVIAWRSKV